MLQAFGQVIILWRASRRPARAVRPDPVPAGCMAGAGAGARVRGAGVFLVFAGLLVPAVRTIVVSFRDDKGKKWLGFDNFHEIFSGKDTRLILFNTFTWVIGGTLFVVIVALAVARFADGMRGRRWRSR